MGNIIFDFSKVFIRPIVSIERTVDNIEKQKLHFTISYEAWLATEGGSSIYFHGRDENFNLVEVMLPISVSELKEALKKFGAKEENEITSEKL